MDQQTYTISELAREFGQTLRALRFWEDKKMLNPARKGSTRIYSEIDRARVRNIVMLSDAGFTLREVRAIFALPKHEQHETIRERLAQLRAQLAISHSRRLIAFQRVDEALAHVATARAA